MLDFTDQFFDVINNSKVLRKKLKQTLLYLESDIKADNIKQRQQLVDLIDRDPTLADEDAILAHDLELIKQLENERLKEKIQD